MKLKILFLSIVAVLFATVNTYAQTYTEVVYLKNGSIIKGTIIELIPNESLKIETRDGSTILCKLSEVAKITRENGSVKFNQNVGETKRFAEASYMAKPRKISGFNENGYFGTIELGYSSGIGEWGAERVNFNFISGYKFNQYIAIGGGTGLHYYYDGDEAFIPVFAYVRANLLDRRITPFAACGTGYSFSTGSLTGGFYVNPEIGVSFRMGDGKKKMNLSLGYSDQWLSDRWYYRVTSSAIIFKVGYSF